MKTEKKLYRVDINLKYLVLTDKEYKQADTLAWLKNEVHGGELDDEACTISLVKDSKEVNDFEEGYCTYYTDPDDDGTSLEHIIDRLGLDASKMIERLKKLGYKVTKK
jgi:hypothetical protein